MSGDTGKRRAQPVGPTGDRAVRSPMTDEARPTETRGRMIRGWTARFYDAMNWVCSLGGEAKTNREIVERAGIKPGERVLDVGCGKGGRRRPAPGVPGPGTVAAFVPSPAWPGGQAGRGQKNGPDITFRGRRAGKR